MTDVQTADNTQQVDQQGATQADDTKALSNSLPGQIAALAVGGSVTITRRLNFDNADRTIVAETTKALRNTLSAASARAGKRTGFNFLLETTKAFTRTDDLLIHATATRIS